MTKNDIKQQKILTFRQKHPLRKNNYAQILYIKKRMFHSLEEILRLIRVKGRFEKMIPLRTDILYKE